MDTYENIHSDRYIRNHLRNIDKTFFSDKMVHRSYIILTNIIWHDVNNNSIEPIFISRPD